MLGAALLALAAAGCFTGPINRPPEVHLSGPDTLSRKQVAQYHAVVTDPDEDVTHLKWAWVTGDCSTGAAPADSDWVRSDNVTFMVSDDKTDGPFCIWATATDTHNATGTDHLGGNPQNQAPAAKLSVVAPDPSQLAPVVLYPLYSTIALSSLGTFDPEGDTLHLFHWNLDKVPSGSVVSVVGCENSDHCSFTADLAGEYDVTFTASDTSGAKGTASLSIRVDFDRPPCIQTTSPDYHVQTPLPHSDNMFSVDVVSDDGDPLPRTSTGVTQFRWYVVRDGQPFNSLNNNFPSQPVAPFPDGVTGKVRVETLDRNPATANALFGCGDDKDFCEAVPGSGCFQRVTWNIGPT